MAVNLTVIELAGAIRVGDGLDALEEPVLGILTRLLEATAALVERTAPNAPTAVQNEAVVRCSGWLFDVPDTGAGTRYGSAMRSSGAMGLLAPWRVHRIGGVRSS